MLLLFLTSLKSLHSYRLSCVSDQAENHWRGHQEQHRAAGPHRGALPQRPGCLLEPPGVASQSESCHTMSFHWFQVCYFKQSILFIHICFGIAVHKKEWRVCRCMSRLTRMRTPGLTWAPRPTTAATPRSRSSVTRAPRGSSGTRRGGQPSGGWHPVARGGWTRCTMRALRGKLVLSNVVGDFWGEPRAYEVHRVLIEIRSGQSTAHNKQSCIVSPCSKDPLAPSLGPSHSTQGSELMQGQHDAAKNINWHEKKMQSWEKIDLFTDAALREEMISEIKWWSVWCSINRCIQKLWWCRL